MTDIIGLHNIPKELIGEKDDKILSWARDILRGQEPKLTKAQLRDIREGKISKIFLEPKVLGFYLPSGEFVPAYDYSPPIGSDLKEAEKEWQLEEEINSWVDEENKRFNKERWSKSKNKILDLWEHGKRIYEFAKKKQIPIKRVYEKLQQRGSINDYESMKHEFCIVLYQWKKDLKPNDPILSLNWKKLAHVIMFAKSDDRIKDFALHVITSMPFKDLTSSDISLLLQINLENEKYQKKFSNEERSLIMEVRRKIKNREPIESELSMKVMQIIKQKKSSNSD